METYMLLSGQQRLDGETAQALERDWHRIHSHLQAYQLGEKKGYIVIYLDSNFDRELERAREQSRDSAERLELLAQAVIMAALSEVLPESAVKGCAPVPEPDKVLKNSLGDLGLTMHKNGSLDVSFGLVTETPYRGKCESCLIRGSCSKRMLEQSG
jgi:hypothetical protein